MIQLDPEHRRLAEDEKRSKNWKRWGPYLSDRQWGTVREDYSHDGSCWSYFTHDHARSRAYRWGEDGLLGISDRECRLCFSFAFWNEQDPILKERLFGLTGPEGNNGEDVKECYYHLESLPTHAYMKALYRYPHKAFPYSDLLRENKSRKKGEPEYEITDSEIFKDQEFYDIYFEYAKYSPNDILIQLTIKNKASAASKLHILPTLWFRNTWSWGREGEGYTVKPSIFLEKKGYIGTDHPTLGKFHFAAEEHLINPASTEILFTENETNMRRLFGMENASPYVKDAFHEYVVHKKKDAVNPANTGTKACYYFVKEIPAQNEVVLSFRLFSNKEAPGELFGHEFHETLKKRIDETKIFYSNTIPQPLTKEENEIARKAYAGLLWTKQFYYYSVKEWIEGDPTQPQPAPHRASIRNADWKHLYNRDIISMPDKWEYPWYAAWDSAFHMIPFAKVDPDFAKKQLVLFLREWFMHPNGQIPAYEFAFSDVNPPVHAWACWRIYKMTAPKGNRDKAFLARVFHKLLLNFTWWVNRKDLKGNNLFSGGFLGLDNIGVFDRSAPLPFGGHLEQADATAWMGFYCATMLSIALELASLDASYGDVASKFFEHFISITDAINRFGGTGLWDQLDGFYYDQLHIEGNTTPLRIRSLVGIIPLLAVEVLENRVIEKLPGFKKRMDWFLSHRKDLGEHITHLIANNHDHDLRLLAVPTKERLTRMLHHIFDENEFLSPFGIRSLSKIHKEYPYVIKIGNQEYRVDYTPGESNTLMFGGNSNWRGPVWFPINYLFIEALEKYHYFYGDSVKIEYPAGSGKLMNLKSISLDLSKRLASIFLPDPKNGRPCYTETALYQNDPEWKDHLLFHEYFHGETGRGLGASHQTGWTSLIVRFLERIASERLEKSLEGE
jgi:hypothetical protein